MFTLIFKKWKNEPHYSCVIHYIPVAVSPPSRCPCPLLTFSLTLSHLPPPKKIEGLPKTSTNHSLRKYYKTMHQHSYQDRAGLPSKRKKSSSGKRLQTLLLPKLGQQATQQYHLCEWPRSEPYRISVCWFRFYESLWTLLSWFCGLCSPGGLCPSHNNWARHLTMSITEYHYQLFHFISLPFLLFFSDVWFYPVSLGYSTSST